MAPRPPQPPPSRPPPGVLFTGFEPSGDDHASVVIAELRRRRPDLAMHAWGGPKMERAGAILVERTGDAAVMGLPGAAKIREHRRINERIRRWLREHPISVHVPVDSPSANFPICAMAREHGARVVHLVAPQIWAWGPGRIRRLRRLTDLVCCVLPFEEGWFTTQGVPARFVGHPIFDRPLDLPTLDRDAGSFPRGSPRLAILPGSRPGEFGGSWPLLLGVFRRVRATYRDAVGVVGVTSDSVIDRLRSAASEFGGLPPGLEFVSGKTDAVARWCDAAVAVSGTVTLQVARHAKPMVVFYRLSPLAAWIFPRFIMTAEFFALPNLVAGEEIVPERFVSSADPGPVLDPLLDLLGSPERLAAQTRALARILERFEGRSAALGAASAIEEQLDEAAASAPTRAPGPLGAG